MISDNLKYVTQRIAMCCNKVGRPVDSVKLICVTKNATVDDIDAVIGLGVKAVGENRVQDAMSKHRQIKGQVEWHLIGHLQTNKVRDAVAISSLIHSVDTIRLAGQIDKEAARIGKMQEILVQVNTSGEETKFGIETGSLAGFINDIAQYKNIKAIGLMTMAPEVTDTETVRPFFRRLRELRDQINSITGSGARLNELSMGMTNDFEVAVEEGSTIVRVGRAIFGS